MLVINHNANLNFGWLGPTHKDLSYNAAKALNEENKGVSSGHVWNFSEISQKSVLPDQEPHQPGSHSANIKKLRDNDALANFKKYNSIIEDSIAKGNTSKLNENVARALHYLQDMMNPFHVIFQQSFSKKDVELHNNFEKEAIKVQSEYIQQAQKISPESEGDFFETLYKKMADSKVRSNLAVNMSLKNKPDLKELKQKSIIDSYHISYLYLKKLKELL